MSESVKQGFVGMMFSSTHYKMFNFMVSILLLLILSAVLEGTEYGFIVVNTMSSIVFILGVYAVGRNRRTLVTLIVLGLPWFICEWAFTKSSRTIFTSMLFFIFVTVTILEHILKSEEVTTDTLYGAVCVYLLLGIMWASIYGFLEYVSPGIVFEGYDKAIHTKLSTNELIYYSYTTLATIGYGDITSVTPVGRIISVLEAIFGQLYIAFLVARLISIYTTNALRKKG
ncbi:MAG: two pore domain potassium channel family protein [Candidatus Dadabacteria bacterium]|nr:MAG: two pore domain potassium channel family protein [Candidatus Dadabacteria bacterium]